MVLCCAAKDTGKEAEEERKRLEAELEAKRKEKEEHDRQLDKERKLRAEAEARASQVKPTGEDEDARRRREEEERRRRELEAATAGRKGELKKKLAKLQATRDDITMEAHTLLDNAKSEPLIRKLEPEEVSEMFQGYISDFSNLQIPVTGFAMMEFFATFTFAGMAKCEHFIVMWLSVDAAVTLASAVALATFVWLCLGPVDRSLARDSFGWGRMISDLYGGPASTTPANALSPEARAGLTARLMKFASLGADMSGFRNTNMFYFLACATGGVWLLVTIAWIPFWSVIGLLKVLGSVATLFMNSCDPALDGIMFAFIVGRLLFLCYGLWCLWCFYTTSGYAHDYVIAKSHVTYLERMEAGLGMRVVDKRRYKWWPDFLKPKDIGQMERIDNEIRDIEMELAGPVGPSHR